MQKKIVESMRKKQLTLYRLQINGRSIDYMHKLLQVADRYNAIYRRYKSAPHPRASTRETVDRSSDKYWQEMKKNKHRRS